jgi:hypothetical protein
MPTCEHRGICVGQRKAPRGHWRPPALAFEVTLRSIAVHGTLTVHCTSLSAGCLAHACSFALPILRSIEVRHKNTRTACRHSHPNAKCVARSRRGCVSQGDGGAAALSPKKRTVPTSQIGHELSLTDADWPTASDGEEPFAAVERIGGIDPI